MSKEKKCEQDSKDSKMNKKAINDQIRMLKGRYSNQIYQIRESITKFLDKGTGTLGERIRTLFKEQGVTIVSILTAVGMAIGVLIEALLGGPTVSTTTSGNTSWGAWEWIKHKLKALSQLLGKLADKALAALPGIIGSIISWILNRAKEVIGWLNCQPRITYSRASHVTYCILGTLIKTYHLVLSFTLSQRIFNIKS